MTGSTGKESDNDWLYWKRKDKGLLILGRTGLVIGYNGTERINTHVFLSVVEQVNQ